MTIYHKSGWASQWTIWIPHQVHPTVKDHVFHKFDKIWQYVKKKFLTKKKKCALRWRIMFCGCLLQVIRTHLFWTVLIIINMWAHGGVPRIARHLTACIVVSSRKVRRSAQHSHGHGTAVSRAVPPVVFIFFSIFFIFEFFCSSVQKNQKKKKKGKHSEVKTYNPLTIQKDKIYW